MKEAAAMKRFVVMGPYNQGGFETDDIKEAVDVAATWAAAGIYDNEKEGQSLDDDEIAELIGE